jgi:hypothetical protein
MNLCRLPRRPDPIRRPAVQRGESLP